MNTSDASINGRRYLSRVSVWSELYPTLTLTLCWRRMTPFLGDSFVLVVSLHRTSTTVDFSQAMKPPLKVQILFGSRFGPICSSLNFYLAK